MTDNYPLSWQNRRCTLGIFYVKVPSRKVPHNYDIFLGQAPFCVSANHQSRWTRWFPGPLATGRRKRPPVEEQDAFGLKADYSSLNGYGNGLSSISNTKFC